jgi:selenocysteine lyase/cysteine desulfurase
LDFQGSKLATIQKLRDYLPRLSHWHYLNYARTGPILSPAVDLLKKMSEEAAEPLTFHSEKWTELFEGTRASVARLINADADEIAFVRSTSEGLSLVANAVRWKKDDRVLYPADEFPSNRIVWENLIHKGVKAEAIAPQQNVSFAQQIAKMNLSHVRLVAVSAVSYWDGRIHDIAEIVRVCHAHGILVVVDAIQALGAVPFDVRKTGCDFLAAGGQKWLFGPLGSGFVYIRKERLEELFVSNSGWMSVKDYMNLEADKSDFVDSARRFESGTQDIATIAALGSSIDVMHEIGWSKIFSAVSYWNEVAQKGLKSLGYQPMHEGTRSGIVAIRLNSHSLAEKLKKRFLDRKIILVQRNDYLRVSAHASATQADFDAFFEAMKDY